MKKLLLICWLLGISVATSYIHAQQTNNNRAIIDELNTSVSGKGKVAIYEDEVIKDIVGRSMQPKRTVYSSGDGAQYVKMRGFKIQAFAGNNQRRSKDEAYYKQRLINTSFPEQETVVIFDSPFWRLRVGNFKSREDANAVLQDMRRTFPGFGKEMYIVIDEVKVPVEQL